MAITFEKQSLVNAREVEILECVASGMSAKEIARRIDLAPRTVERYIEMIRLKLRARNSVHMVTCAIQQKLIEVTPKKARPDAEVLAAPS
jgi:DNA-binding CsgD family transcriptional regulator